MLFESVNKIVFCCLLLLFLPINSYGDARRDDRSLLLELGRREIGRFSYGDFLYCLKNARFESETSPRDIETGIKRLVVTTIHGKKWNFEVREEIGAVIIEGITVNTQYYSTYKDKSRLLLHIFSHCQLNEATHDDAD